MIRPQLQVRAATTAETPSIIDTATAIVVDTGVVWWLHPRRQHRTPAVREYLRLLIGHPLVTVRLVESTNRIVAAAMWTTCNTAELPPDDLSYPAAGAHSAHARLLHVQLSASHPDVGHQHLLLIAARSHRCATALLDDAHPTAQPGTARYLTLPPGFGRPAADARYQPVGRIELTEKLALHPWWRPRTSEAHRPAQDGRHYDGLR